MILHTIVEPSEADLEAVESRKSIFLFDGCNIYLTPLYPFLTHALNPFWCDDLDVLPRLCDITILGAINVADDKMGNVGGEVELNGSSQFDSYVRELVL